MTVDTGNEGRLYEIEMRLPYARSAAPYKEQVNKNH